MYSNWFRGCILADEMGLGMNILNLIFILNRENNPEYFFLELLDDTRDDSWAISCGCTVVYNWTLVARN